MPKTSPTISVNGTSAVPGSALTPPQRPRLVELRDNLHDRIAEVEQGWLGDIEGLTVSLAAANDKLADLDKLAVRKTTVHLGMPSLDCLVGRSITAASPH